MSAHPLIDAPRCTACTKPFGNTMFNAMHAGTVCGCVWHHHCLGRMGPPTVVPPKCPNHPNLRGWFPIKRYTMTECMLCETAVGVPAWLCALCHTSVADMTARTLRLVGSTSWKKLYRDTMVAALWPAFFRHVVDVDDVDHDGVPEDHIHPLVRVAWMCIVAIIRSRSTLAHVADDDTVWDLGAWIERSFLALPARNYKVEVIKTLPAFKELKGSEEDLIRAFRVYLTESKSSKIVEVRRGIIRKKTTLNIFSAKLLDSVLLFQDLERALSVAEYTGVLHADVLRECRHAQRYITELGSLVVELGDRLYAAGPIQSVSGLEALKLPPPL